MSAIEIDDVTVESATYDVTLTGGPILGGNSITILLGPYDLMDGGPIEPVDLLAMSDDVAESVKDAMLPYYGTGASASITRTLNGSLTEAI